MEKIIVSGKRKSAVAKAVIVPGDGKITINRKDYKNLHLFDKLQIEEPLRITKEIIGKNNFDVWITVKGGGERGRIEAAKLALSKAIVEFTKSKELRKAIFDYDKHLLVADIRRKEPYKPGDSKARRKRQKSYR
ncbi:MAG: 30S ribosomal protein S9 [Nanoarchaeota archaeon]